MEHFYESIQGWADGIPTLYESMVNNAKDGDHFVEIGSWRGKSTAYLAVEIVNSGKKIKLDCVDTWQGSLNEELHQTDPSVVNDTLFDEFVSNMKPVEGYYTPVRSTSTEAANLYEDGSLDFVFIDAQHDYESVTSDIAAWISKVKPGGILAGHDLPHPPVRQAVADSLSAKYQVHDVNGCWVIAV
jgi:predicted O-methyltransferase YrrM